MVQGSPAGLWDRAQFRGQPIVEDGPVEPLARLVRADGRPRGMGEPVAEARAEVDGARVVLGERRDVLRG